ncbi:hypothetical protein MTYM_00353 [Methylococcales bacterium]|nr:hypothetical protein MTYM_00353 [Methylococcales bacterium]
MSENRRSIMDGLPSLEGQATAFSPKKETQRAVPPPEKVAMVAKQSNFTSREGEGEGLEETSKPALKRKTRHKRTGRTSQFTARCTQQTAEEIYAFIDSRGIMVSEAFEMMWLALKEKEKLA